jgi:hypothetical protein
MLTPLQMLTLCNKVNRLTLEDRASTFLPMGKKRGRRQEEEDEESQESTVKRHRPLPNQEEEESQARERTAKYNADLKRTLEAIEKFTTS